MRYVHVAAWSCAIAEAAVVAGYSGVAGTWPSRIRRIRTIHSRSRKASRRRRHGGALPANDCCPAGPHVHRTNSGHSAEFAGRNADVVTRHLLRIDQRTSRNRGESVGRVHVRVTDIVVRAISAATRAATVAYVSIVVHIRYMHVGDARVRDVHAIEVAAAHVIPGNVRFTKSERAPAVAKPTAKADAYTEPATAEPRHQRGCIVRTRINRSWRPSPGSAPIDPASIVERSIAPRLIFNPGPSPGRNPNPVPVAIRRPAHADPARHPDCAIIRRFAPGSIFVQVFRSRDVGRNVAR
jgi:hypothetical protein